MMIFLPKVEVFLLLLPVSFISKRRLHLSGDDNLTLRPRIQVDRGQPEWLLQPLWSH